MNRVETGLKDRVVRVLVTDDQWKDLKYLAIERNQEIREVVTAALQTSPLTERIFTQGNGSRPVKAS